MTTTKTEAIRAAVEREGRHVDRVAETISRRISAKAAQAPTPAMAHNAALRAIRAVGRSCRASAKLASDLAEAHEQMKLALIEAKARR